jgi:hypothetical protein
VELLLSDTGLHNMAHFAELDSENIVIRVVVIDDEHEDNGVEYCHNLLGGRWIQTSYNHNIRKQYAGVGYSYDDVRDEFVLPQPFPSWSLNEDNDWQAPIEKPEGNYRWDEGTLSWVELPPPPAG